jgi:hypothetical protein
LLVSKSGQHYIVFFQQYIVVSPSRQTIHCDVSDALLLEGNKARDVHENRAVATKRDQKATTDDTGDRKE